MTRHRVGGAKVLPGPFFIDEFRLVEPVDGLSQSVVVAVADTSDGALNAGGDQAFRVFVKRIDRYWLPWSLLRIRPFSTERSESAC